MMMRDKLASLGWKPAFQRQLSEEEVSTLKPVRVASHHGSQIVCLHPEDELTVPVGLMQACGDLAVGDWILMNPETRRATRRLERESLLARKAPGSAATAQLIAANIDTLFIVTSCNHDFSPSRLERYLALAAEAQITPVVVLTKTDLCDDPDHLRQLAGSLQGGLIVEMMDARSSKDAQVLEGWCRAGQTVGLVGSSGVGKSTLATTLGAGPIRTQGIREDDSKGRHTTTARCIHQLQTGGLLIDTPGMRELQLADCASGLEEVFDDVTTLAESCRFRDCRHESEPGCGVQAALEAGTLDPRRFENYVKLQAEQARNARTLHERREAGRQQSKLIKNVLATKSRSRGGGH